MDCVISITVKGTNGDVVIDVPFNSIIEDKIKNNETIDSTDIVKLLKEQGKEDILKEVIKEINNSGFKNNILDISTFENGFPIGNYSVGEILNNIEYRSDFEYLRNLLVESGMDLSAKNILITNRKFDSKLIKVFKDPVTGKELTVLSSDNKLIHNYIISELSLNTFNKFSPAEKSQFKEKLTKLLEVTLEGLKKNRTLIKNILNSEDIVKEFIRSYYLNKDINNLFKGINLEEILMPLFDQNKSFLEGFKDPDIKEVASLIVNSNSDLGKNKVSLEDISNLAKNKGYSNPLEYIFDLNKKTRGGKFLKIKYLNDKYIAFDFDSIRPNMKINVVNSEYTGQTDVRVSNYMGYNIFQKGENFYISDAISTSDLKNPIKTYAQALGLIEYKLKNDKFREGNSLRTKIKMITPGESFTSKQTTLKSGDRISVLDVKLHPTNSQYFSNLLGDTYESFMRNLLSSNPNGLGAKLFKNLEDVNFVKVINTSEKLKTLVQLMEMEAAENPTITNKFIGNGIVTSEYIAYVSKLMTNAVKTIENAKEIVYELSIDEENNHIATPVESEIPIYTSEFKDFSSELIEVAETLERSFGNVKIHTVSSTEINKITNNKNVRACVLNGEIFLNTDRANTGDILHEYAHLVFGFIKGTNLDTYMALVDTIRKHPNYAIRLEKLIESESKGNIKRALPDLQEELFVTMFGEMMANTIKRVDHIEEFKETYKDAAAKVFQLNESLDIDLAVLNKMTIEDIFNTFGTQLFKDFSNTNLSDISYESRRTTNVIGKLKKNNHLKEICE